MVVCITILFRKLFKSTNNNPMPKITQQKIKELTLLLLWLTSWEENISKEKIVRSWKGYDFDILNELLKDELVGGSHKSKSVYLTEKGVEEAEKLEDKYL